MARIDELDDDQKDFFLEMLSRARSDHSQSELGELMGTSQQQVSRLEKREVRPTMNMARRLDRIGYLRIQPFMDRDFDGADPLNPPPVALSSAQVQRLRDALDVVRDILSRLP